MFSVITTALALAMDAFSVSVGAGASRCFMSKKEVLSLAAAFGFFQFAMPLGGWFLESETAAMAAAWNRRIAALLLAFIGTKAMHDSIHPKKNCLYLDVSRPGVLLGLALVTSMDAMAAGFSMAAVGSPVFVLAVLSGLITAVLSALGALAGRRIGRAMGYRAEFAGGLVLLIIGLSILRHDLNRF